MSQSIQFFATRKDLENLFGEVEQHLPLSFTLAGRHSSEIPTSFQSIEELPALGTASASSSVCCTSYLVSESDVSVVARKLTSAPFFAFDQLQNPNTLIFNTGGIWKNLFLLRGYIGTTSKSATSGMLMKLFKAKITKGFSNIRGNFVGPEAEQLLRQGFRLTSAEQSPVEFDLAL
jgi:hypothetical protein